jgi:hypothetical protein
LDLDPHDGDHGGRCHLGALEEWLAGHRTGSGLFATERTVGSVERLGTAKESLQQYGNYDWLTAHGNFAALHIGIEFAGSPRPL